MYYQKTRKNKSKEFWKGDTQVASKLVFKKEPGKPTRAQCTAHRTLLSIMWPWEKNLKKNRYNWNSHSVVNQLCQYKIKKFFEKEHDRSVYNKAAKGILG